MAIKLNKLQYRTYSTVFNFVSIDKNKKKFSECYRSADVLTFLAALHVPAHGLPHLLVVDELYWHGGTHILGLVHRIFGTEIHALPSLVILVLHDEVILFFHVVYALPVDGVDVAHG